MRLYMKRHSSDLRYPEIASFYSIVWRTFGHFIMSLALVSVSFGLMAQAISPQMMAQFQSMPLAQQQALAAQYGVDLDQIMGGGAGAGSTNSVLAMPGEALEQRRLGRTDKQWNEDRSLLQDKLVNEFEKYLVKEKKGHRWRRLLTADGTHQKPLLQHHYA